MAAEDIISPSGPREYLESPKDVEEACPYESEEDTDEEWEFMDDDDSDALSGSEEVLYLSFISMLTASTHRLL